MRRALAVLATVFFGCGASFGAEAGTDTEPDSMASSSEAEIPTTPTAGPTGPDPTAAADGSGGADEPDPPVFDPTPTSQYAQRDRVGAPGLALFVLAPAAVATLSPSLPEDYNETSPAANAAGQFDETFLAGLTALQGLVGDELQDLGFTLCAPSQCRDQLEMVAADDSIQLRLDSPSGFPNGRLPSDQSIDIMLAALLLDLESNGQSLSTLAEIPLNPSVNDTEFLDDFPHLAPPNTK